MGEKKRKKEERRVEGRGGGNGRGEEKRRGEGKGRDGTGTPPPAHPCLASRHPFRSSASLPGCGFLPRPGDAGWAGGWCDHSGAHGLHSLLPVTGWSKGGT